MSKKHGQRKRRKKAARKRARAKSAAGLLHNLADALNACDKAGLRIRLGYGYPFCEQGIVLPPTRKGQHWEARPFAARPDGLVSADPTTTDGLPQDSPGPLGLTRPARA